MVTSIIYLVVFALCFIVGGVRHDWWSWLAGVAFGISVFQIAATFKRRYR